VHGLVGVADRHVDVHPEDDAAPGRIAQRVQDAEIACLARHGLILGEREWMRTGGRDPRPDGARVLDELAAQGREPVEGLVGRHARRRRDLDLTLVELALAVGAGRRFQHPLDRCREPEVAGVDEHVLLLHAQEILAFVAEAGTKARSRCSCGCGGHGGTSRLASARVSRPREREGRAGDVSRNRPR
jgi:hypothetical protein